MSKRVSGLGLALAATGLAHFARPTAFDPVTAKAFPTNTRRFTYINGGLETVLGLGLAAPRTRKIAVAGLLGYLGYLGASAARSR